MMILVAGGSGFLGARLIPRLADDRHEVFAPRGPPHRIKSES
jgi:nucleoside-diphosphate-sugar epimerase